MSQMYQSFFFFFHIFANLQIVTTNNYFMEKQHEN